MGQGPHVRVKPSLQVLTYRNTAHTTLAVQMRDIAMFTIALSWPVNEDELRRLYGYVSDACRIISPKSHNIDDLLAFARGLTPPNLVDLSTQA